MQPTLHLYIANVENTSSVPIRKHVSWQLCDILNLYTLTIHTTYHRSQFNIQCLFKIQTARFHDHPIISGIRSRPRFQWLVDIGYHASRQTITHIYRWKAVVYFPFLRYWSSWGGLEVHQHNVRDTSYVPLSYFSLLRIPHLVYGSSNIGCPMFVFIQAHTVHADKRCLRLAGNYLANRRCH